MHQMPEYCIEEEGEVQDSSHRCEQSLRIACIIRRHWRQANYPPRDNAHVKKKKFPEDWRLSGTPSRTYPYLRRTRMYPSRTRVHATVYKINKWRPRWQASESSRRHRWQPSRSYKRRRRGGDEEQHFTEHLSREALERSKLSSQLSFLPRD